MEDDQHVVKDLKQEVERMKGEVDALQIAVMKQSPPWYKNVPTIISVFGACRT